jgi:hypothetical protein
MDRKQTLLNQGAGAAKKASSGRGVAAAAKVGAAEGLGPNVRQGWKADIHLPSQDGETSYQDRGLNP